MIGLFEYKDVMLGVSAILTAIALSYVTTRIIKETVKRRVEHGRWGGFQGRNYIVISTEVKCDGEEYKIIREDRFRVLAKYEGALLIEILGDKNNPYFVEKYSA